MSTFVIYDTNSGQDLGEYDRLVDAYQEMDMRNGAVDSGDRFAVRLAKIHRAVWQRWVQAGGGRS